MVAEITLGTDVNGKQMRKTFYGETRKEVKDEMEKVLDNLEK